MKTKRILGKDPKDGFQHDKGEVKCGADAKRAPETLRGVRMFLVAHLDSDQFGGGWRVRQRMRR